MLGHGEWLDIQPLLRSRNQPRGLKIKAGLDGLRLGLGLDLGAKLWEGAFLLFPLLDTLRRVNGVCG